MFAVREDVLREHGIDCADARDRFDGNMELYERLAIKFLDDRHVEALLRRIEAGDSEAAYREAHSLKGVAGNLSFSALYRQASALSDALCAGDLGSARALMPQLLRVYDDVVSILEPCRQGERSSDALVRDAEQRAEDDRRHRLSSERIGA